MKISKKQKEVILLMREGTFIHWIDGLNSQCFLHSNMNFRLSTATTLKLEDLKIIEADENGNKFTLTELGKSINLEN
jgi:hypothetical protein